MKPLKKTQLLSIALLSFFIINMTVASSPKEVSPKISQYIKQIEVKYKFKHKDLLNLFQNMHANLEILNRIDHPYEKKTWPQYHDIFFTDKRIKGGVQFWKVHQKTLEEAEKKYGVPADLITAIIGVETNYGENKGAFPVFEALSTLAFYYKPRAHFFKKELTEYLLLIREQNLSALKLKGSYAGAIGIPQFMPSVYRRYAVSYANKAGADLDNNPDDAIFSIANYLHNMGWNQNEPIAVALKNQVPISHSLLSHSGRPHYSLRSLEKHGIKIPIKTNAPNHTKAAIIAMSKNDNNLINYWLTFGNFYAIMRYNPRINYAMVVYQLGEAIKDAYKSDKTRASTKAAPTRTAS